MSFDIDLVDQEGNLLLSRTRRQEGGTYVLGGTNDCSLNVTYNYSLVYSIRDLDGQRAGDTIPELERRIDEFGTERGESYWDPVPGNVGHALSILLDWAMEHPDGVWRVED